MASTTPDIPARFLDPSQKYALIVWLVESGFPARIGRDVLAQWGAALGVSVDASDYAMIDARLAPRPVSGA